MKKYIFAFIALSFLNTSCEKAFIPKSVDPGSKEAIFQEFWDVYEEKYAMFEAKGVDWKAAFNVNKPKISEDMSNDAFFEVMGNMVKSLRDGHSNLKDIVRDSTIGFDILKGADINYYPSILINHLKAIQKEEVHWFLDSTAFYGLLEDNIGYILIGTFNQGELLDDVIDKFLTHFKDTKGLIIDVRNNSGGDPSSASRLARHFTNKQISTGFERFKIGPTSEDFKDSEAFNDPSEGVIYTKPVMVLTNGLCYSATTTLIYQLNPLDMVTFIGSQTGGGSGSVADGFLANGFRYQLSVSEFIDYEGRHLDDGFDPDIEVWINQDVEEVDEVLQRAIDELN